MNIRVIPIERLTPAELQVWSRLQRANPELHNPFFRAEFAIAVGRAMSNAEVAVFEANDEPVAFFPFERHSRVIGRPIGGLMADMHGIIGPPDFNCNVVELLRKAGLCTWIFDHLVASQPTFKRYHECVDQSLHMNLRNGFKAYCEERRLAGASVIQKTERRKRQLAREVGPLRFEWCSANPEVMSAMFQWKSQQLRQQHYVDVFDIPGFVDLLYCVQGYHDEAFSGVVSALYAGEHLVAMQFGVQSYEVLSVAIPAFNPQFSKYSPGLILHLELARQSEEWGVTHIELGRGENQLKTSLMSGHIPLALGAVDLRPMRSLMRKAWFRVRNVVHSTPLKTVPLNWYRRIRNRVVRNYIPNRRPDKDNAQTESSVAEPVEEVLS